MSLREIDITDLQSTKFSSLTPDQKVSLAMFRANRQQKLRTRRKFLRNIGDIDFG